MNNRNRDTDSLKRQFAILKGKGFLQKEIAKELGVSEKTVSSWAKNLPISHYYTIRDLMQKRLTNMLTNNLSSAHDIANLANALTGIEKTIERQMKPIKTVVNKNRI